MINDSQSTPTPGQPTTRHPQLPWIVAAVALALIILVVLLVRSSQPPASGLAASPVDDGAAVLVAAERERQALAKAKLQSLHDQGEEINGTLKQAEAELTAWREKIEPELKGPKGRALATDADSVRKFSQVYELPRPTDEEIRACRARVSTLLEPAGKALSGGAALYVPDDAVGKQLQTERNFAADALRSARNARQTAEALLAEAAAKGPGGSKTLEDAMTQANRSRTEDLAASIAAKEDKARREAMEREADARAHQIEVRSRQKVKDIEDETAINVETARRESLLKRAKDPAIQANYAPFLAKGRANLGGGTLNAYYDIPAAVSLSLIQQRRALDSPSAFANAGAGKAVGFRHNDRPTWSFPRDEQEMAEMGRRLEEFRELAPVWVELGLLQP